MDEAFPYELIKPIGGGGFGDVWLARQKKTETLVAVKIMRVPDNVQNNQEARQRFMREIEIARLLNHPHILPALAHGYMRYNEQELPYLVSPYMPDGSLGGLLSPRKRNLALDGLQSPSTEQLLPWEQWSVPQTIDALSQAAEALEYIHTLKPPIVHQDVKPGNFLFRWERDPARPERVVHLYLCDFGISRWQKTESDVTTNLFGSIPYMAPERLFEGKISWTTDLYALAVMAYLFLVGDYPVRQASDDWNVRPPSQVRPDRVPHREMDNVLLKALDFSPQKRYSSVLAFARALQLAARGEADSEEERTSPLDISIAETVRPFIPAADERIPVIGPAPAPAREKPPTPAKPSAAPLPFRLPFQQQQQRELPPLQVFSRQVLYKVLPTVPNMARWSRDGQSLLCTFYGRHDALVVGKHGQVEALKEVGPAVLACWGPGDRALALSTRSGLKSAIRFWQRDISSQHLLVLHPEGETGDIDWSQRGQLAVWEGQHISLYALPQNLSSQPPVPQTLTGPDLVCGGAGVLRWSPDGAFLAAGTLHGTVMCWNMSLETPTIHCQFSVPDWQVYSVAWSPDGACLAAAFSNKSVVIWDVPKNELRREWKDLPCIPRVVSLSTSYRLAIASPAVDLLFGSVDDPTPTGRYPGQWFVAWSPIEAEFASLHAHEETTLVIWGE
jgi:serine/threonine protein kinase